jgi:hypothetical protein
MAGSKPANARQGSKGKEWGKGKFRFKPTAEGTTATASESLQQNPPAKIAAQPLMTSRKGIR